MKPVTLINRRTSNSTPASVRPASIRVRWRVRLHRWRLDRALAEDLLVGHTEDRAWRACQLASQVTRRRVADSLRRVVAEADGRQAVPISAAVPVRRSVVLSCREGLLGLAERLEAPDPVSATAVARTLMVLCDGAGPLYQNDTRRSLEEAMWWIADGMETWTSFPSL